MRNDFLLAAVLPLLAFCLLACQPSPASQASPSEPSLKELQRTAAAYMALPQFVGPDFVEQLLGHPLRLHRYDRTEQHLYFSFDSMQHAPRDVLPKVCLNVDSIDLARQEEGRQKLGRFRVAGKHLLFFRTHLHNLRLDRRRRLEVPFPDATYTLTLPELRAFLQDEVVYGGLTMVDKNELVDGTPVILANHSALVAKAREPSLQRLVEQLVDSAAGPEQQAQQLLDFVTQQIAYSEADAQSGELLKRANEVLLSREADCSGKVILYASLLQQIGLPHLLLYQDGHISVGVGGNFSTANGQHFTYEGQAYHLAETTYEGFRIGETSLAPAPLRYIQRVGRDTPLRNWATGDSLSFF